MATEQVEETVVEQLAEVKPSTEQQPQRHSFFRTRTSTASSIATDAPTTTTTSTTEASTTTRRTVFRNRSSTTARPSTSTTTTTTTAKAEPGEEEADDVPLPTPLPKRRVIVRGNYRPRKEGDLSSLLAVDGSKRVRYNHQPDPISPGEASLQVSKSSQQVEVTSEAAVEGEKVTKSEESINRIKVNSRAPLAAVRNRTSSQTETLGNGITRTRTTYVRTLDEGKVVKRVHTKTIQEKPAEYEYIYHEVNEPAASTTPRVITRNRGSVRFQSNDLSSLLALDFASRSQRNKQTQSTVTKTRTRVLKKPKETLEHEEVEEFVYDAANDVQEEDDDEVPAVSRPSTQAPVRQQIRTRRPTTTTRTTTARSTTTRQPTTTEQSVELEQEATTRRTSFRARRPTARASTTTTTTEAADVPLPTRRVITIKRPISTTTTSTTTTTTEKPEESQEPSTEIPPTTARNFIKHLTANKSTTTTEATTKETTTTTTTTEATPSTTTTRAASPELTDDLTDLKVQFTNALHSLQSDSQTKVEATTSEDDLKEASSGERLSLPIYHRRKYFQYVKDSPITYIDKSPAPAEGGTPTVDIQKQIHDVFNVSDNGTPSNSLDDGEVDSAEADHRMAMEQAREINSELSHFLLNTPGSV